MIESIGIFYDRMAVNKTEIKEIADWIAGIREELKMKILKKQDMETKNNLIYTYMHDLLGVDLMEVFDKEHMSKP
jgi:hypothetical protein